MSREDDINIKLTHIAEDGSPHIVNISHKKTTYRVAQAHGWVELSSETLDVVEQGDVHKGDVLSIAKLAGICGSKKTSEIIPLCHPIAISYAEIELELDHTNSAVNCVASVSTTGKTGVEIEALYAVQVSLLTIYDMCKAYDKTMIMNDVKLTFKSGGSNK